MWTDLSNVYRLMTLGGDRLHQAINQSINQSINQIKSNKSIDQSINQSINQIKSNQIKSNQIKSNQIKSNQINQLINQSKHVHLILLSPKQSQAHLYKIYCRISESLNH